MIKESVTIDEVIEIMNEAISRDRKAINALVNQRIECNESLADHPTIQVRPGKSLSGTAIWSVGLLGILNGLFGVDDISGYGTIAWILDSKGMLEKLTRVGFKTNQWEIPMTRLEQLGTIAFDASMMRKLIDFGKLVVDQKTNEIQIVKELAPDTLELSLWLQFVPDIFKDKTMKVAQKIFKNVLYRLADEGTKERFIISFQQEVDEAIGKRELTNGGWK